MVIATININKETNRILNIIKAKYGLNTKSQAIEKACQITAPQINEKYKER